ncbi:hypothetical protein BY458DRAFT_546613 [Sporodiniella umbellata]|nr:hypothetical protein BY458DRAFT_546613 [Sporodiniella umbellata]
MYPTFFLQSLLPILVIQNQMFADIPKSLLAFCLLSVASAYSCGIYLADKSGSSVNRCNFPLNRSQCAQLAQVFEEMGNECGLKENSECGPTVVVEDGYYEKYAETFKELCETTGFDNVSYEEVTVDDIPKCSS